ncbi:MAG: PAS domain S-box protein [bacterium]
MDEQKTTKAELIAELQALREQMERLNKLEIEYKKVSEELLECEERFRIFSAAIYDGILIHEDERILDANYALSELLGYRPNEVIGRPLWELFEPRSWELIKNNTLNIYERPCEANAVRRDGSAFPVEVVGKVCRYRGRLVRVAALRDILERKKAEKALRESEERFRSLSEASFEGVFIHENGRIMDANHALLDMFGYELSEAVGETGSKFVDAESWQLIQKNFQIGNERPYEIVAIRKDGMAFPAEIVGKECHYHGQKVRVTAIRDITARKRAEAEIREAKEAAEAANRAKSEFLASISHDIRTPISAILGYANLLEESALDAEQRDALNMILFGANNLLGLMDSLLDLSKIEAGRFELLEELISLDNFLEDIRRFFAPAAAVRHLALTFEPRGEKHAVVTMDPIRVRQMLGNLLSNALKFTDSGGIHVQVDLKRERGLEEEQRRITISVTDTGIGIPAEKLSVIFKPFEQGDAGIARKYGGTGLGLSITQRIVHKLGGEIHAESRPGKGSTFTLSWILRSAKEAPIFQREASAEQIQVPELKGKTILVVDDDPINRKLLVHTLESTGVRIYIAATGAEALSLMREHLPHLVLMDMWMPVMDGFETTRQAKADSQIASIPVIALTACTMKGDRARCLEAGCDGYLSKPVARPQLLRLIGDFLLAGESARVPNGQISKEEWLPLIARALEEEYKPQLARLLSGEDLDALHRFGHTMKGLGLQFGLPELARWGEELETCAESPDAATLREKAAVFYRIADEIIDGVQKRTEAQLLQVVNGQLDKVGEYR